MKSAPVTGITLCTHLGRHSGTHFDIGLAVITQFPGRKGRWNRKVARSAEKYCLTKVYAHLQLTTRRWRNERRGSSAGKGFGEDRARTMNQKNGEVESQLSQKFSQVHSGASSTASAPTGTLFVGRAVPVVSRPPASSVGDRWETLRNRVRRTHSAASRGSLAEPE